MARTARDSRIDSRTSRIKLKPRKAPYRVRLEPGKALGYYKPAKGCGSWWALLNPAKGDRSAWKQQRLGPADDFTEADGETILNFAQAQAKAREWFKDQSEMGENSTGALGSYTVEKAMKDYLDDGRRRGMKSIGGTECAVKAHILPALGGIEISKLSRTRIESWMTKLAESPKRVRSKDPNSPVPKPRKFKNPRKPKPAPIPPAPPMTEDEKRARKDTANRILTILKAALNHALDRRRVKDGSAWKSVKPYAGVTSARIRFLSVEEQQRLVNVCPRDFANLVRAALYTGARYGELTRLRVSDFNPKSNTILIAVSKSGKPRHIFLDPEGLEFFTTITAGRSAGSLLLVREGVQRRARKDLTSPEGWAYGDQSRLMSDACAAARLDPISFHELRHTYASILVNAKFSMAVVAAQLGHSGTRMTEKHYAHLAPNAIAEAIRTQMPTLGIGLEGSVQNLKIQGA